MITSRVWRGEEEDDARFAWVLEVRGLPSECRELRWEQFVSGGFTIEFTDRTWKYYSTQSTMQQINPQARQFGPWSDDLLDKMTPGPRPVTAYLGATCRGVLRPPSNWQPGTMRGPSADPRGATFRFEDAPGFSKDFGDTIGGKTFRGIQWQTMFVHKLWLEGEHQPIHQRHFSLTGRWDQFKNDTRKVL